MPTLDSAASDILDAVVNSVKELCHKKRSMFQLRRQRTKVKEKRVNSTATELKVAQEKLGEFLTCHKDAVEEQKNGKMEKAKRIVSTLLSSMRERTAERDLISEDKVSILSPLLTSSGSPLWSQGPRSPAEQIHLFCDAAVKHLLRLFLLSPGGWAELSKSRAANHPSPGWQSRLSCMKTSSASTPPRPTTRRLVASAGCPVPLAATGGVASRTYQTDDGTPKQKQKKRKNIIHFPEAATELKPVEDIR
ncbi:uncharacterized protein AKAME5_000749200 [Lates japonicus]|uniref:Uncharacterized protein n=1 Tax=Lates japonicus TaxID=270547 RepID=A0AAD3R3U6_LATJO|nr:uncharacterized protein AKAME5_000749200 [Lates japonicus]